MVAKSKAGTAAEIKKKIASARTEADRRALVFELKKAEKAEKAKPAAKAKAIAKKPAAKTTSKAKPAAVSKTVKTTKPKAKAPVKATKATASTKTAAKPKTATKAKAAPAKSKVTAAKSKPAATKPKAVKTNAKVTAVKTVVEKKTEVEAAPEAKQAISGYGSGGVETVISVEEVTRQVAAIAEGASVEKLEKLAGDDAFVTIENLHAGYGKMEILHDVSLRVGRKQSLCLIGPNGAGKSTVLHAIFGFNNIFSGSIKIGDGPNKKDVTKLSPNQKLSDAGIAYILQDKSVFPGMTVEENLWMGGFLKDQPAEAKRAAEQVFDKYPRLAARRKHLAKVLSGGERRLLEISRALVMDPEVLLVDEPSIGLEPRFIDMVFEILHDLQHTEGKTIIMVEQNAKKGLEFADIGYVLVNGEVAIADKGDDLLANPKVGELFLGG